MGKFWEKGCNQIKVTTKLSIDSWTSFYVVKGPCNIYKFLSVNNIFKLRRVNFLEIRDVMQCNMSRHHKIWIFKKYSIHSRLVPGWGIVILTLPRLKIMSSNSRGVWCTWGVVVTIFYVFGVIFRPSIINDGITWITSETLPDSFLFLRTFWRYLSSLSVNMSFFYRVHNVQV